MADQGQLADVFLDAFSITKDVSYSFVARDILDYLRRDMIGPEGEIFSAEDVDSAESPGAKRKKEGAFYVWTSKEIDDILGEHANIFKEHYYIKPTGNCDLSKMSDPHNEFRGKNVLIERNDSPALASKLGMPIEKYLEILGECRQKLFDVRLRRPRTHLDDKGVIVSWNGLVISSFARASKILKGEVEGTKFYFPVTGCDPKEYMGVAEKAASFIRRKLYHERLCRLQHSFRNGPSKAPGFLDDYAFLISGLLDLYEFGGRIFWLVWAIELQNTQAVFGTRLKDMAMAVPLMCCAADLLSVPHRKQVVSVGHKPSVEFENMLAAAHSTYDPNRTVIHIDPNDTEEMEFWEETNSNIAFMAKNNYSPDSVVALVCQNFTCSPPVVDPKSLETLLSQKPSSSAEAVLAQNITPICTTKTA
ncbi:Spermatogenesis-associated 20 [Tripterygium wilfordii]|uniref:Spermatogenesis-associated 20 n=1 Tax=Tripterygium wilfordii TaxID=458696 RepID=A0A7J7DD28_TRIWF|nr:Spermatogenesis-associated 20 [Tripterygium wilfordii]